jgi:arsenate reductase
LTVTLYHRPQCATSRKVLALIRSQGIEPVVIDYVQTGWTKDQLAALFTAMKLKPRDLLRVKGTPAEELGLTDPSISDARLLTAMVKNPLLVERPVVVSEKGVLLARPPEKVLDIL